eukprot:Protomagalhaensia_wolfi_Nauph_80__6203@NODE_924_length_1878_cov_661_286569_g696_i0_p2_GENE_NODE_924_length_1878_cov_661_286569_g696_i0NODE_924_length_1878_cov_661_286569_g696_i0_p2_ORF_typecomplete_len198_score41_25COPI_assoc/PF08507_10/1_1e15TssN/PF17555_2/0_26_NODE_924_length_1878_cov_661_286569_g696_i011651758
MTVAKGYQFLGGQPGPNHMAMNQPLNNDKFEWKDVFQDVPNLNELTQELEGPKPLRLLAALGGLGLAAVAALKLLNFTTFFTEPWRYVLECYMVVFGIAIVTIEAKSVAGRSQNKQFLYKWFPFVSIVGGKGITYIFFGTLGLSFGWHHLLMFGVSAYVGAIGVAYCLIHFAKFDSLGEKYNQTVFLSRSQGFFTRN